MAGESFSCYVFDKNRSKAIYFNVDRTYSGLGYASPEGYTDSYSANYEDQSVRGRSSPFKSYVNSGPRIS